MKNSELIQNLKSVVLKHLPNFAVSIIIVIIAYYISNYYYNAIIRKYKDEAKSLIYYNIANLSYYLILIIGFFIAICNLGFEVNSLLTIFATLGIATALALQGLLKNVAAGFSITFTELFNIKDIVEVNGTIGTIIDFDLLRTTLSEKATSVRIIIPNDIIQNSVFKNYTKENKRTSTIPFTISNNNTVPLESIFSAIKESLQNNQFVQDSKNVNILVTDLSSYGTTVTVLIPINSFDMLKAENLFRTIIRKQLQEMGVLLLDNAYAVSSSVNVPAKQPIQMQQTQQPIQQTQQARKQPMKINNEDIYDEDLNQAFFVTR
jgi:small conductance mechanosensitive channel